MSDVDGVGAPSRWTHTGFAQQIHFGSGAVDRLGEVLKGLGARRALLVTTALDQSIASVADLHSIPGVAQIVTVPPLRLGSATHRRRRRGRHAVQGAG